MRWVTITALWYSFCFFLILSASLVIMSKHIDNPSNSRLMVMAKDQVVYDPTDSTPLHDIRHLVLKKFLTDYRSPLKENVDELVKQADLYAIDYALIPAIAMQESGGCKNIPMDSYNCWGFGIYGGKITKFQSYNEAISQVAKTIKETYIKSGLTNVTLLEDKWVPPSRGQWSSSVNFFIGKIREYEKNTPAS